MAQVVELVELVGALAEAAAGRPPVVDRLGLAARVVRVHPGAVAPEQARAQHVRHGLLGALEEAAPHDAALEEARDLGRVEADAARAKVVAARV